jgi:hypothetical protein
MDETRPYARRSANRIAVRVLIDEFVHDFLSFALNPASCMC